jgi:predicted RNA-binding Zn-ribbon protein involved in translation (DUF1610 family)
VNFSRRTSAEIAISLLGADHFRLPRVAILAGTKRQFDDWARGFILEPISIDALMTTRYPEGVSARYISGPEDIRGRLFEEVVIVGTFWERLDAGSIYQDVIPRIKKAPEPKPVDLILFCPMCHERHIDEGEWATKEHRTHECQSCGFRWAPAAVPTRGVAKLVTT